MLLLCALRTREPYVVIASFYSILFFVFPLDSEIYEESDCVLFVFVSPVPFLMQVLSN